MTHRGRRVLLRVVLGTMVTFGLVAIQPARADSCDDARCALDRCEERLCGISWEIASARQTLDQAVANQAAASSNLSAALSQVDASQRCIANAQNGIDAINGQ